MEYMDIYTSEKQRTSKIHTRDHVMNDGDYRFVVSVLIFNSAGKLLIQKRQSSKTSWANWWDYTAGGAVITGESLYEAAQRELLEETGIIVDLKDVPSRLTVSFEEGWDEIYFVTKDIALNELVLQEEEVSEMKWVTEQEYLQMLNQNEFIPYIYAKSIYDFYRSQSEYLH
ncbi:hypothetical protein UAY_00660 [Enterococcus moraviensis ATCC BAA-383]|uniref:Nudix hydrolase domain-containing protein n=2 Tax=Enterococcus moraviensis TaxID=155617 RepID=R2TIL5_9ENTE|nr:hypothetical protein UAY_00660 [Enterococcus moraviensis ATCC BAA-383]EOT63967.1 hypothetical protein I586_03401 [Enterococcus moraviensis ATCC BAA-383]